MLRYIYIIKLCPNPWSYSVSGPTVSYMLLQQYYLATIRILTRMSRAQLERYIYDPQLLAAFQWSRPRQFPPSELQQPLRIPTATQN